MELQFVKMHGIGNDFVLVDCMGSDTPAPGQLARTLCRRRFGIGADGLLAVCPSDVADYRMRIFNADGSEAAICGNGLRCVGKYAYEHGISCSPTPAVETGAGIRRLHLAIGSDNRVEAVTVNMGHAVTAPAQVPLNTVTALINSPVENCGEELRLTALSVGNPHGVVFVSDLYGCKFELLGPRLECHEIWPEKANIEFVQIIDSHHIAMRAWERGVGETLACGSGACAAAAAAVLNGQVKWPVEVQLSGGTLSISADADGSLLMTGPAAEVFSGIVRV
ncbi:MAG: diaminopimelate epimerase [Muribaculaceae bacterium]|nr:diaminopimelate epimerase [Muribaculaceae bacterium]